MNAISRSRPSLDTAADAAAWRDAARALLADTGADLAARYDAGEDIDRVLGARSDAVDAVVHSAWTRCIDAAAPLNLLATGGYGRGELFPQSDVDLLVLAGPEAQEMQAEPLSAFFGLLWDAGLVAGHAVRSPAQCFDAAADVTVMTALLEIRLLAGDPGVLQALREAIAPTRLWTPRDFFLAKREEQRQRHARFHDTAYNLEPNLKEGPGGLRDLHTLAWMAKRVYGVPDLAALLPLGQLGEDEHVALERERRALSRLRYGLHLVAGRREERLVFDHQKALAARLGLRDERRDNLAVEQMMQGLFRSAAIVLRISDRLLQRFEEQLEGEGAVEDIDLEFVARRGYLALREPERLASDPALAFRLFAIWAERPELRGLHSHSARALAEALPGFPDYREASADLRAQFLDLLRGTDAVATLARMARLGVLARWLPAFGWVSGRMQYDLFHVYTVDQHTLTVLRNVDGFARGQPDPRFALAHEVWPKLRKPELLLLAALFHDIAKGRGGDHSELGAVDAHEFCSAHGLPHADVELVAWLVRRHLLMSVTAQKQDIADPDVVARFSAEVADRERLDYLYLLTCADIAGTSPKLWNAWKDRLLADLYAATRFSLRRGLEHPVDASERIAETRAAALTLLREDGIDEARVAKVWAAFPERVFLRCRAEEIAWQTRGILEAPRDRPLVLARKVKGSESLTPGVNDSDSSSDPFARALEVFVHSPDRDGLFAALVATLDRLGLSIVQARVMTSSDGMSLDGFHVLAADGRSASSSEVSRALLGALSRPLDEARPPKRSAPRQLRHFRIPARIEFEDAPRSGPEAGRTVLSLVCTDRPGLLADVAQVLRGHRLRVHDARIATFGERAEDFFQITDGRNRTLDDPQLRQALREALAAIADSS